MPALSPYLLLIKKYKVWILLGGLLLISIPLLVLTFSQKPATNDQPGKRNQTGSFPTPSPLQISKLGIASTSPTRNAINVGIYPVVTISFSRPVSSTDQKVIQLSTTPSITGKVAWQDNSILTLTPTTRLQSNTAYTVTLTGLSSPYQFTFTTVSEENISTEDKLHAQAIADKNYADYMEKIDKNYPWYDHLPLHTTTYFVYFDTQKKQFIAKLYPTSQGNQQEIDQLKDTVLNDLKKIGVNVKSFPIEWQVQ